MATDIVSLLTQDEIPIKLRCARCNKLALSAFRLPCCDQSICESCHITLPEECPVCSHSPLTSADCKPNKALRLTVKAFLKGEEKRREKAAAVAAAAEAKAKELAATPPAEASVATAPGAEQPDGTESLVPRDDDANQPSLETDASASQTNHTVENGGHKEASSTVQDGADRRVDRTSTVERDTPDIEIITGDEQRQNTDVTIGDIPSQPKTYGQQPQMNQFNFNGFGQNMNWNPAMMQQMLAMQNTMNAGNWGGFQMMGMNGMGMDPSMMNMNMMGGMNMGGNNWGWNQQQGMGNMGTENMMNMSGNFNATGGYAKNMASMNSGAGYNAQLMSQHDTSQSHMNNNHGRSISKDVAGDAVGANNSDNNATARANDFLPGDAGDSRPNSPGGDPPQLGLSTDMSHDTLSIQNGESAFSPMMQTNGAMNFDNTNSQQFNTYTQDSPASSMYPQAPGYGNEYAYNIRGRGGYRGRGFSRGRGGRFNDFDPIVPLTGSGVGQGVEGAPTGPKAMREPPTGPAGGSRGGRGGFMGSRGAFASGMPAARTMSSTAKPNEQKTPREGASRASSRRRSQSRSRSAERTKDERDYDQSRRHEMAERSLGEREQERRGSDDFDDDAGSRRNGNSSRHHDYGTSSRRESRRHSPDVNEESDRERRRDSHRSSRHQRDRSRDKERRHRSSRHHDYEDRSRSRDRERRKHRYRSRSPVEKEESRYDDDNNNNDRKSSRHHRHREERHRERESEREHGRDKESSRKEGSSRRDRDRHERDRHRSSRSDANIDRDRPSTSNGHAPDSAPTGPRNDSSIPTGPRGTTNTPSSIPTGPRNATKAPPKEYRIHGRSSQPAPPSGPPVSRHTSSTHAAQDSESTSPQPTKYIDAHALEREARNRERLLKEQQRRGSAFATSLAAATSGANIGGSGSSKRRASGDDDAGGAARGRARRKGRGGVKYEDEDGHGRARRVEEEREAARWG